MDTKQTKYMRELRRILVDKFGYDDVHVMAQDLGVDFENLSGDNKKVKANNLILHMSRQGRLEELAELMIEENPSVNLPNIPSPSQQIQDEKSLTTFASFQSYIEKVSNLVEEGHLTESSPKEVIKEAEEFTLRALWSGNTQEKVKIVGFLHSLGLINSEKPIISLKGANLYEVVFKWATLTDINLSGASLAGAVFEKTNLERALFCNTDLRNSKFTDVNLDNSNLQLADLRQSNFSFTNLRGADFENAYTEYLTLYDVTMDSATIIDSKILLVNELRNTQETARHLRGVDLSNTFLVSVDLKGADLENANLANTLLEEARLSGANLKAADLKGSILMNADLASANLKDADLRGADCRGAVFSGVKFQGCLIDEDTKLHSRWLDVWKIVNNKIDKKDFRNAELTSANFKGVNLSGFDLRAADLSYCDFRYADLSNCDLRGANLASANISEANLTGAKFLATKYKNANLSDANLESVH